MPVPSWRIEPPERSPARRKLDSCIDALRRSGCVALSQEVQAARARLDEPMRVAVAGQVSRGKSTLVNAIIGEDTLAVGRAETTFNVSELHYRATPSLRLHYKDGRAPTNHSPEELHRLTVHSGNRSTLSAIRKVEVGLPNEFLRDFRLIDTPGLRSVYAEDSANAAAALGVDSDAAHRQSVTELEQADAILFLFSRGVHEQDLALVADFAEASPGAVSPVQSIGVLSKVDEAWPPAGGDPLKFDPIAQAGQIVNRYMRRPDVSRLFYALVPIAGLVAHGAGTLGAPQLSELRALAQTEPAVLAGQLGSARRFVAAHGPASQELLERLGPWGTFRASRFLAENPQAELPGLRQHLWQISGVAALRAMMSRHFGNRSGLIKLHHTVRRVQDRIGSARAGADPEQLPALDEATAIVEDIEHSAHSFKEMRALSLHYSQSLDLSETEIQDLLCVTGENGDHIAARLGLPPDSPISAWSARAGDRKGYWSRRVNLSVLGATEKLVARTVLGSYERIAHRVATAQRILDLTE